MKLIKYFFYLSPIFIFILINVSRHLKSAELGSKSNPIKFYLTPSEDANKLTTTAKPLMEFLQKETGYYFTSAVPSSYVAIIEAFGTGRADVAIGLSAFAYLMANEKYGATALLRVVRDNGETTYRGQFLARVDSGIDSISDLQGKSIAYVDPSSTSGYLLPKAILKRKHIKPSEEVFAMRHDNVVTMVYQRQVDAGACFYSPPDPKTGKILDARMKVLQQFPDVAEKVKTIGLTEEIPNDPVIFRKDMPEKMKQKIVNALLDFVKTPQGQQDLYDAYGVVSFVPTKDSDYDVLRKMLKEQNIDYEKLIGK
ncbi:phosphate/phosphite/phosphonate ABC transporter substrate-binding protein [Melioribacteraceae bacterium 4301-Me]|uniref:phosphate/phosphite/phosphonate ABC transporter substrate-binding protein n=1 Tax=Pyranulibacter aquaticus TaxID=3163344 RepID=UPI003597DE1D